MAVLMDLVKKYKGIEYKIEICDNGSNYSVYEYTPVFHTKAEIVCGSSCDKDAFTCKYVEKIIDDLLEANNNVELES